jgi:hypothetical protein
VPRCDRFLDHRFGTGMIDPTPLRAADAVGFAGGRIRRPLRGKGIGKAIAAIEGDEIVQPHFRCR